MDQIDKLNIDYNFYHNCFKYETYNFPWTRDKFENPEDTFVDPCYILTSLKF